jgi:hypothetical protein
MYGGTPQDPKHVKVSEKFRNCVPELPGRWKKMGFKTLIYEHERVTQGEVGINFW